MGTMSNWYVYIVKCNDDTLYTGITNDVNKRVKKHNAGRGAKYTKVRLPVVLVWTLLVGTKSEAAKLEYQIKQLTRLEKLALIEK